MTDRKIIDLLAEMGVPEMISAREFSVRTGISYYSIRMAMASGDLPRAARGIISRAAAAEWISRQPSIIAQLMRTGGTDRTDGTDKTRLCIACWRDDISFTVKARR